MLYKNLYCSNCNQTFSTCHDHGYPCGGEAIGEAIEVEVFQRTEILPRTVYNRCGNCNRVYNNYNRCGNYDYRCGCR